MLDSLITLVSDPQAWIALITLLLLEIVLGIDNIIFISILVGRLPTHQRQKARMIGLGLAMGARIILLLSLTWIIGLVEPLFTIWELAVSGKDLILMGGGLFLLGKSTHEIHNSLEGEDATNSTQQTSGYVAILAQIALIDIIFSLDSVITAVGLASQYIAVMVIAVVLAVIVMMFSAKMIGDFVDHHPTIKMLALSFLILVGFTLFAEGLHLHISKGYVYFAMAFSVVVELLNIRLRSTKKSQPVKLHKPL